MMYEFHDKILQFLLFDFNEFMKMKNTLHEVRFGIEKYTMT